jgi:hypothetical protein
MAIKTSRPDIPGIFSSKIRISQILGVSENNVKSAHPNVKYVITFRYALADDLKKQFTKTIRIGDIKNTDWTDIKKPMD